MMLMNANGVTTMALGVNYVDGGNGTYSYRYDADVRTTPHMNLVCDVASDLKDFSPCRASVLVRLPQLERTVIYPKQDKEWTDVVGQAGSYFALSQLVSWILSGQFFAQ